jgi:hypothetical protein
MRPFLRNARVVGIDKVAVGEMLSWYGFDSPRLCMNEDPRNFLQIGGGVSERARAAILAPGGWA